MKIRIPILVLLLSFLLSMPVAASPMVSPALNVISARRKMIRSTDTATIEFTADDFDRYFGCRISSLTVTELPEATSGSLMLGSLPLTKRQTVSRDYLDMLRFSPSGKEFTESSFSFTVTTDNGKYQSKCALLPFAEENGAPTAAGIHPCRLNIAAEAGIDYYGTLSVTDPENDRVDFEILQYPENTLLTLTDKDSGTFKLSVDDGFVGSDSFSYTARDEYGQISEPITVSIEITDDPQSVFYSDLGDHWAHTAAIRMTKRGIMSGYVKSGMRFFDGDANMTFCAFVSAAMKALGHDLDSTVGASTVFWDNDEIPCEDVAYISEAAELGYISGRQVDGRGEYIDPLREITRAEAALILSRMTGISDATTRAVFADETSVPAEALEAVYLMNSLGIMYGTGNTNIAANEAVTRAQAAVMLDRLISLSSEK